jgi:AmiR/NasT family two-component response regulator
MNLFSSKSGTLSGRDSVVIEAMANVATISVMQVHLRQRGAALNAQLQHALESRIVIEQAKGVLAHRHGISMDAAFTRLRGHARAHQAKLRDAAEQVVANHLTL